MTIELATPDAAGLAQAIAAMRPWQVEGGPFQLHPGDLGWNVRFGVEATAAAVRTWSRDGQVLAVGFLDEPTLVRMVVAPDARSDDELARAIATDLSDTAAGVLPEGEVALEVPRVARVRGLLAADGWVDDEAWTPLRRDLGAPVEEPGLRIEVVGPAWVAERVAVQRSAFARSTFTEEAWAVMAAGGAYDDARCLVGLDPDGTAVAAITVWSAGEGRPGVIEPMGVHAEHRGRGFGRGITLAGARALQELGSSSAVVATPSANVGGVAAYVASGFRALPEIYDLRRPA